MVSLEYLLPCPASGRTAETVSALAEAPPGLSSPDRGPGLPLVLWGRPSNLLFFSKSESRRVYQLLSANSYASKKAPTFRHGNKKPFPVSASSTSVCWLLTPW